MNTETRTTPSLDQIRDQQRETWDKFSAGWKKWDATVTGWIAPFGEAMIRHAGLREDSEVLDIAAGTGEPGLTAAARVPRGRVTVTDLAGHMLEVAAAKAAQRGLRNVATIGDRPRFNLGWPYQLGGGNHAAPSSPVFAERSHAHYPAGNNRQACFFADEDYRNYLDWLGEYAGKTGCRVHAYVLMTNHVHLLISAEEGGSSGALMKAVGQRYVQYVNRSYRRSGTLWEGRFRSCLTQEETYLLACQRYIELNPVRADMVAHPAEYRWSSYRANAQGEEDALVRPHSLYESLGRDVASRQAAYRELFRYELEPGLVNEIRRATNGNYALGNERFVKEVASALGRRATPGTPGRPRQTPDPESGDLFDA